ncbi:MAG TPA: VOC family protein [Pseudaminobacter sp.]|nr:VOC family protein [Pseudaminobacter sp.]
MAIDFNHTILSARDSETSAKFLSEMLGLPAPRRWGPFQMVTTENGANLDYMDIDGEITPQHYAFLVSEAEFDEIFGRIRGRNLRYWADPGRTRLGEINHHDAGCGVYFEQHSTVRSLLCIAPCPLSVRLTGGTPAGNM